MQDKKIKIIIKTDRPLGNEYCEKLQKNVEMFLKNEKDYLCVDSRVSIVILDQNGNFTKC